MQNIGNDPLFREQKDKAHTHFRTRPKFSRYNMSVKKAVTQLKQNGKCSTAGNSADVGVGTSELPSRLHHGFPYDIWI